MGIWIRLGMGSGSGFVTRFWAAASDSHLGSAEMGSGTVFGQGFGRGLAQGLGQGLRTGWGECLAPGVASFFVRSICLGSDRLLFGHIHIIQMWTVGLQIDGCDLFVCWQGLPPIFCSLSSFFASVYVCTSLFQTETST